MQAYKFDTAGRKCEAVKEDLEVPKTEILTLQQSHPQAQPRPQRVPCDSARTLDSFTEKLAV